MSAPAAPDQVRSTTFLPLLRRPTALSVMLPDDAAGSALYNRWLFAEFAEVTMPFVVASNSASRTWAALAVGKNSRYSAATPAAWGAAIEVPLRMFVAKSSVYQADVMPEPGAKKSTQGPQFENAARSSDVVVAPIVMASGVRAGDSSQASALLLPAATA